MHAGPRVVLRTVPEAAAILGVHRVTVYKWIRLGLIGCHQHGQRWTRISDEHIAAYLSDTEIPPDDRRR